MNLQAIESVAREYNCALPIEYTKALLNINTILDSTSLSEDQKKEITALYFYTSPDRIASKNAFVREKGITWTPDIVNWPARYFVIGDDQCGNHYYLDTSKNTNNSFVHFYDHDVPCFRSLNLLPRAYIEDIATMILESDCD